MRRHRLFRQIAIAAAALMLVPAGALAKQEPAVPSTETQTVTVHFDAGPLVGKGPFVVGGNRMTHTLLEPWEHWARFDQDGWVWPDVSPKDTVYAPAVSDRVAHAGLELLNSTTHPLQVRLEVRLPRGLWQGDAALLRGVTKDNSYTNQISDPPHLWRMESVLRSNAGVTVKNISLQPGEALFLRWTETIAQADRARQKAHEACGRSGNRVMQNRVSPALEKVGDTIDSLLTLAERGDRDKIVKRVHTALLATAKAQAVWQNWREAASEGDDTAFDALTAALSEVSCAACNLVPSQTLVPGAGDGPAQIRVGLTNAGGHTLPLATLGLSRRPNNRLTGDRTVFRSVAPGANVAANFSAPPGNEDGATQAVGVVQFIWGMGAAVVPAQPAPPEISPSKNQ